MASDTASELSDSVRTSALSIPTFFQRASQHGSAIAQPAVEEAICELPGYERVDWKRLRGLQVPQDAFNSSGKIWRYGYRLWRQQDDTYWWLCMDCHHRKRTKAKKHEECLWNVTNATNGALDHLTGPPHLLDRSTLEPKPSKKRKVDSNGENAAAARENEAAIAFHPLDFKAKLYDLIISNGVAFNLIQSEQFRELLIYLQPRCKDLLPCATTVSSTIASIFSKSLGVVTEELASSISKISISFDIWTSKNQLAIMAICAHFISGSSGEPVTTLLAFPRQRGRHSGVAIAETIGSIIADYSLQKKLGYFITDNASNNSTALDYLAMEFGFDKKQRWIHCAGHVLNLVAQAILFGNDTDAFEEELDNLSIEELELQAWRKRGPIGKLHNVVWWMSRSGYLKEELERAQLELIAHIRPDEKREVYELKRDVPTRWNSFDDMAERALYLQPAIEAVMIKVKVQHTQQKRLLPAVFQDELNDDDWSVIKAYHDILKPIKKATTLLQGHAGGRFGCIWQVLPIYEQLLTHFEKLRGQYLPIESMKQSNENSIIFDNLSFNDSQYFTQEAVDQQLPQEQFLSHQHHFATNINLGWQKLNHYYSLLDESPVYVAAIVLHPAMKWRFIEESWSNLGKREWIRTAKKAFNDLLNETTADQLEEHEAAAPPPPQISANTTHSSDDFFSDAFTIADEAEDLEAECTIFEQLQEFIKDVSHRKAVIPAIKNRPLHTGLTKFDSPVRYWIDNRSRWPQLARLALDIYSTPAMSDEPERQFSTSGVLVEPRRRLLSDTTIRNLMCVRSWITSNIVTLSWTFFGRSELKPAPSSTTSADVSPYPKPPIVTIDQ